MNDFQAMEEKTAKNCQRNGEMLNFEGAGKKILFCEAEKEVLFSSIYLQKSYKM